MIGGGIGGLTSALALRRSGLDVVVLEREASLRETPGIAILRPGAVEALHALGLAAVLEAVGEPASNLRMRTWDGKRLTVASSTSGASVVVDRQILHSLLDGALDPDPVVLGADAVDVGDDGTVALADGTLLHADVVVDAAARRGDVSDEIEDAAAAVEDLRNELRRQAA